MIYKYSWLLFIIYYFFFKLILKLLWIQISVSQARIEVYLVQILDVALLKVLNLGLFLKVEGMHTVEYKMIDI